MELIQYSTVCKRSNLTRAIFKNLLILKIAKLIQIINLTISIYKNY